MRRILAFDAQALSTAKRILNQTLLSTWAAVGTADRAPGSDVVRSLAQRADETITEIEGSHAIMISQPDVVTEVILTAHKAAR